MPDLARIFADYFHILTSAVPPYVFMALIAFLCIGLIVGIIKYKRWNVSFIAKMTFFAYVFLIYSATVVFRVPAGFYRYEFTPFWSYDAIRNGQNDLLDENYMNILVFIPIGILLTLAFEKWRWWKVVGTGMLISIIIETMQLAFKQGMCETDDVIHNTLGCVIGYLLSELFIYLCFVRNDKCCKA